jgi:peptide/nickel transport system permease protein
MRSPWGQWRRRMGMWLLNRFVQAALTVVLLLIGVFVMARLSGDPTGLLLPQDATQAEQDALRQTLGLDQPYTVQFWRYVEKVSHGDFGDSLRARVPATDLVRQSAPNTIRLGVAAVVISVLFAIPLGVWSALKRGTPLDAAIRVFAVLGLGMPGFVVAIVLISIFSVWLNILPPVGMDAVDVRYYLMPVIALASFSLAALTRLVRASLLEALDSSYVRYARLKGLSETRVVLFHALPNSLLPVVTFIGINLAVLIGGTTIVETVFGWPGIGRLAFDAVRYRDFPLLQAIVVLVAISVVVVSLIFDVINGLLDPRVRLSK